MPVGDNPKQTTDAMKKILTETIEDKVAKIKKMNDKAYDDYVKRRSDFKGILRGEEITLKGVKTQEIQYVKRTTVELEALRKDFNTTTRKSFLQDLANDTNYLKKAGFSESDILKMKNGRVPDGWQVHHKLPLDDSGTNTFDNLILIKNEPYHKVITNFQNSFSKQLLPGEIKAVKWPVPDGSIYPPTN